VKKIKLTQGMVAIVDDDDYERVSKYKWHYRRYDRTAQRELRLKKKRIHICLHHEILETNSHLVQRKRRIKFHNNNKLDCRKKNLAFGGPVRATKPKESTCSKCKKTKPIEAFTFNSNPQIWHIPHRVCKECKIPREFLKESKCTRCNKIKPIEKFGLTTRGKRGRGKKFRGAQCIQCVTDRTREYRQDPLRGGRPEIKEHERAYRRSEKRQKAKLKRREKFAKELEHNIKNNIKLQCTDCKVCFPGTPEYFTRDPNVRGGLCYSCKSCKQKRDRISHEKYKDRRNQRHKEYRDDPLRGNRPEMRANRVAYRKEYEKRPLRKMRQRVSKHINLSLKRQGITKDCKSIYDILGYTPHQLKEHLKSGWKSWMNWDNYGHGTGKWTIGHRIPQAALSYKSLDDPYFKKAWGLDNLFPQEFTENIRANSRYKGIRYLHKGPNISLDELE